MPTTASLVRRPARQRAAIAFAWFRASHAETPALSHPRLRRRANTIGAPREEWLRLDARLAPARGCAEPRVRSDRGLDRRRPSVVLLSTIADARRRTGHEPLAQGALRGDVADHRRRRRVLRASPRAIVRPVSRCRQF